MDERAASRRAEVAAQHTGSRGTAPPAWVAWSLSGVGFTLVGAALVLVVLGSRPGGADAENFSQGVATTVAVALVGGLVASRRPSNPLGWLFLGIGLSGALGVLTERYAAYALVVEPGSLPGAVPVAWLGAFAWFPAFGLVPLALLLFPDGRLPGRRWRAAAWAAAGGLVVCTVCLVLTFLGDPVASVTAEGANPSPPPAVLVAAALGVAALVASGVAAVAAVVLRWRRSGGDQRQQLKCLVLAAATFLGSTLFGVVAANWLDVPGAGLAGLVGAVAVPIGAAVAILRYRLYDLDRVINRTLVYGLLTALLAAVYAPGRCWSPGCWGWTSPSWRSPPPPWPSPLCSSRPGAGSRPRWTGASTGAATMPPGPWRRSAPACATRSTWRRSPVSCCGWWTARCSRRPCPCGSGPDLPRP
jgi:hypothetical protein